MQVGSTTEIGARADQVLEISIFPPHRSYLLSPPSLDAGVVASTSLIAHRDIGAGLTGSQGYRSIRARWADVVRRLEKILHLLFL